MIKSVYVATALALAYLVFLNYPINTGSASLPPLGPFFNPFSGFWQNADPIDQSTDQNTTLSTLKDVVEIAFDDRAVPHVFAKNQADLAMTQGYLHARDRLWQMDLTARQAAGRLAEVFGERVVEIDRRNRNLGMAVSARRYAEEWKKCPDVEILTSYVKGVNAYITDLKAKDHPLEFKLFNYQPELWSIEKAALVMMSMNLVLCGRNEDIQHTNSLARLGRERYEYLFPEWNPKQSPIIPSSKDWHFTVNRDTMEPAILGAESVLEQPSEEGIGSNNWAIHGSRTVTGRPILCNDPHLQLTLPSIWYEMQLTSPEQNVYGVTFPGIPHIIIGFNKNIAWGQTNVGMDVSDLYKIKWLDPDKKYYELDGERMAVHEEIEYIKVKDGVAITDTIKYTYWGPVMREKDKVLALHWLPNVTTDGCAFNTFSKLNAGENFDEYLEALAHFNSPPQNYVFASVSGDIALKVQGKLPIKAVNQGKFILDGSKKSSGWGGYIEHLKTPMIKNPERGFVSSANQHSTDPTYPYFYHGYFEDYRSRSLNNQLDSLGKADVESMMDLQLSTYSQYAADLCPLLLHLLDTSSLSPMQQNLYQSLSHWDFRYDATTSSAVGFSLWADEFYQKTWDEFLDTTQEFKWPESWRTIQLLEEDPYDPSFDIIGTDLVETGLDLARQTFATAALKFDSLKQENPALAWQDHRSLSIPHLSRLPAFSEEGVKTGGTSSALNAVSPRNAPSWRMIVALGERVQAWGVFPGGASGNPGSPYYKTGIKAWAEGSYFELRFLDDVSELALDNLLFKQTLVP